MHVHSEVSPIAFHLYIKSCNIAFHVQLHKKMLDYSQAHSNPRLHLKTFPIFLQPPFKKCSMHIRVHVPTATLLPLLLSLHREAMAASFFNPSSGGVAIKTELQAPRPSGFTFSNAMWLLICYRGAGRRGELSGISSNSASAKEQRAWVQKEVTGVRIQAGTRHEAPSPIFYLP